LAGGFFREFWSAEFFFGGDNVGFYFGRGENFFLNGQWREFRFGEFFILFRRGIFLVWSGHRIFQGPFFREIVVPMRHHGARLQFMEARTGDGF